MLSFDPLCINVINKCINLFVGQIVLDTKQCKRAAWLGRYGSYFFEPCEVTHPDHRRHWLTTPLDDDMLSLIRDFADQRGKMRFCGRGTHMSVHHKFDPP